MLCLLLQHTVAAAALRAGGQFAAALATGTRLAAFKLFSCTPCLFRVLIPRGGVTVTLTSTPRHALRGGGRAPRPVGADAEVIIAPPCVFH